MKVLIAAAAAAVLAAAQTPAHAESRHQNGCVSVTEFVDYPDHAPRADLETYFGVRGKGTKDARLTNRHQVSVLYPVCKEPFPYAHVRATYLRSNGVAYYVAWVE